MSHKLVFKVVKGLYVAQVVPDGRTCNVERVFLGEDMLALMTGNLFLDFDYRGQPWFTTKRSFRYCGAFPLRHWKTMIIILYSIL